MTHGEAERACLRDGSTLALRLLAPRRHRTAPGRVAGGARYRAARAEPDQPAAQAGAGRGRSRLALPAITIVEPFWPVLSDRDAINRRLSAAADDLRARGLGVTAHLVGGDTVDAVIDVAERSDAALIVIDPRATSVVTPWRAYSLPARMCARAPRDVLLAR